VWGYIETWSFSKQVKSIREQQAAGKGAREVQQKIPLSRTASLYLCQRYNVVLRVPSQSDPPRWLRLLRVRDSEGGCQLTGYVVLKHPFSVAGVGCPHRRVSSKCATRVKQQRKTGLQPQQLPVLTIIRCREQADGMCSPACGS